jgi:hypothetical protein
MSNYIYWKWGNDTFNVKSSRKTNEKVETPTEKKAPVIHEEMKPFYDEPSDKRELSSNRIAQRQLIIQTPINPFLTGCNYLDDLKVQDTLLRPIDSNI